ncbi:MAG TPA: hypothetical protein VGL34_02200 [Steroidobacteraceae bacterium]|jgi:hypothetical protein
MRDGGARRKPFEAYVADVAEALLPQLILRSCYDKTARTSLQRPPGHYSTLDRV